MYKHLRHNKLTETQAYILLIKKFVTSIDLPKAIYFIALHLPNPTCCISKLNMKSIVILVHERKKSYKCQICYLFDTVVVKKMTNIQNLIWKDMLNWFMRGRNKTTIVIKKVLSTNNNKHVQEKKKKPFKCQILGFSKGQII